MAVVMKPSLLVVDDTPAIIDLAVGLLSSDYKVRAVTDGAKAIELATANPPDLVLLDIMMPEMDGYEVCQRLKADPATSHVPVIFVTAKAEAADVVKGLKMGAADYITKPFNPDELLERVHNVVQLVAQQRELSAQLAAHERSSRALGEQLDLAAASARVQAGIQHCEINVATRLTAISDLLAFLHGSYHGVCEQYDIDDSIMAVCLTEAITNAVIHGNLEVPSSLKQEDWNKFYSLISEREAAPGYGDRKVRLRYERTDEAICIEIEDEGPGFDVSSLPDPDDPAALLTSGRGIMLIRAMMDTVEWSGSGNTVRMCKQLVH